MNTEIEAKFLNTDVNEFRQKLHDAGATLVHPERLMKRRILDYPDGKLDKIGGWVRVRDEGDKSTLSYKQQNDDSLHGTKEISVNVSDFEETSNLLIAIGLIDKSYQETKRESWLLNGAEIEIDTWPWMPSFVEVEAPNEETLKKVTKSLGLELQDAFHGGVAVAYRQYYDVSDEQVNNLKLISFSERPDIFTIKSKSKE